MKEDIIYSYYINRLKIKLNIGKINKGYFSLMSISETAFKEYKKTFENNELFRKKEIESHIVEVRDQKIDNIIDEVS